jgi:hypothetical protein
MLKGPIQTGESRPTSLSGLHCGGGFLFAHYLLPLRKDGQIGFRSEDRVSTPPKTSASSLSVRKMNPLSRCVVRYEGRCGLPTNFDATYCYALGFVAGALLDQGQTGLISSVSDDSSPSRASLQIKIPATFHGSPFTVPQLITQE